MINLKAAVSSCCEQSQSLCAAFQCNLQCHRLQHRQSYRLPSRSRSLRSFQIWNLRGMKIHPRCWQKDGDQGNEISCRPKDCCQPKREALTQSQRPLHWNLRLRPHLEQSCICSRPQGDLLVVSGLLLMDRLFFWKVVDRIETQAIEDTKIG